MTNKTKATLAITLQALIIGFSFLIVKIAFISADAITMLGHRFLVAAVAVNIFRIAKPGAFSIDKSGWLAILPLSLIYPIGFFFFQTMGLRSVPTSEAGIIYAVSPILTLLVARLVLKESATAKQKGFMLLSVAGLIFINVMNGFNTGDYSYTGFLFILISAICFAVYNVFARKLSKTHTVADIVYVMSIAGFFFFNGLSLFQHLSTGTLSTFFQPFAVPSYLFAMFYLGVLSLLLTSFLSTYALATLEAGRVGLFNNLSTVVSIIAGALFLKEPLLTHHFIGIVAILTGTIGFNLSR